jgi:ankyrin repeat protein
LTYPNEEFKVDCEDKSSATPLMYACANGHEAIAHYLITLGADVNHQDKEGSSALHYAASNGKVNCMQLLIKEGRAKVSLLGTF